MFIQIFYVAFFMYAWFDTDAFIEYSKLFRLSKRFRIDEWTKYREVNPRLVYLEYLRTKHSNFLIRLITCKQCLLLWISFATCLFFSDISFVPPVYILSYIIYNLLCKSKKY